MRRPNQLFALTVSTLFCAAAANAHVVLQKWEANAGYQEYVTLVVPHGCGPSPTIEVRVKVSDGITIVVPEDKAGWQTRLVMRKLDQPIRGEGGRQIAEVVDEVIWSGGSLPSDRLGLFTMLARMPDAPGRVLYFKTVQKCAQGETRWIDTIPAGEPIWKVWATEHPAPFLELKAATRPQLGATSQQIAAERAARGQKAPPPR